MTTLGLPSPMFAVFVATVAAGSLGAVHYLVAHVLLKRPFQEVPPPVLREDGSDAGVPDPRAEGGPGG